MTLENPFHPGELAVHEKLGEWAEARRNGRAISDAIMKGAFKFIETQPFFLAGTVDAAGANWASMLFGEPGFVSVEDDRHVTIDLAASTHHASDPLLANLEHDARIGMLFIEPGTRRRLRVNGEVTRKGDALHVDVGEAYPNCPKFIQRRHLSSRTRRDAPGGGATVGASFEGRALDIVRNADTFFVASSHPAGHLDVSHRGGPPGFARVISPTTLEIPDYPGNHMYNTLGNFVENPRSGLVFLDFESGELLQATGRSEIVWEREGSEEETAGTNRFWRFELERWLGYRIPVQLSWEFLDASPFNPSAASHPA